jgi:hypothetical protein
MLAALFRAPVYVPAFLPALILLWVAGYGSILLSDMIGGLAATGAALAGSAFAVSWSFKRSLYITAMFARETALRDAATRGFSVLRDAQAAVAVTWLIALAPTLIVSVGALAFGFGPASAAIVAFVFVGSMPLAGAMLSLLYGHGSLYAGAPATAPPQTRESTHVSERLGRHLR